MQQELQRIVRAGSGLDISNRSVAYRPGRPDADDGNRLGRPEVEDRLRLNSKA